MDQTPVTPLQVLGVRWIDIAAEADSERDQAKWTSRGHWIFGAIGLAGSAVAAATASSGPGWIPVVAGAFGALGSGLAAFFHFDGRAAAHERNSWKLRSVAEYAHNRLARWHATSEVDQMQAAE